MSKKSLDTKLPAFKPHGGEENGILYAHVKEDNKKYLIDRAIASNISLSKYIDQLIDMLRSKKVI